MERLGHYDILDRLGAGGMGEVYRARDTKLGRTVAIKVLPEAVVDDPERRERLLREARASAALSHPNICALFEVGGDDTRQYLVFEYVAGDTLRQVIGGRALNLPTAIEIGAQLADALADAHAAGIVHRDIKPENIIITPKGQPKVLDFGLASFTASGASRDNVTTEMKTADGVLLGTVAYMSPEQALGVDYDHRTDIFSLGIVLYEMLTGTSPFRAPTAAATSIQIVQATPAPPSTVNRNVPSELDAIVLRALSKDPNQRHQSGATLAAELKVVGAILDGRGANSVETSMPAGGARWRSVAVLLGAAAAIAAMGWVARAPIARWFGPPPPPLVAVLPLDLIGEQTRTYFADGLTEDMITRLGQLPGVKVLGRSATRDYRGRAPADVARELDAAVVLTGAVQSEGDVVKVNVSLIDPRDGSQIWSGSYQKPLNNIFAVQNEIAEDVARNLRITLTPSPMRDRTAARQVSAVAYDLYLRGRDAAARREGDRAVELYRQAIAADPRLAEALAGLTEALHLRIAGRAFDASIADEMRRSALAAAAVDPDLPQVELALGLAAPGLADKLKHFRRAIDLDPSYAEAYHQAGDLLMQLAPEQALAFFRRSLALDPRAVVGYTDMARVLASEHRFAEAAAEVARNPAAAPTRNPVPLAAIARHRGKPEESIALLEADGRQYLERSLSRGEAAPDLFLVSSMVDAGRQAQALDRVSTAAARVPNDCEVKAMLAALKYDTGQRRAALELAGPLLAAAQGPKASLSDVRCGPMAAAAVGDVEAAAAILRRIASEDIHLRHWTFQIGGFSGHEWLLGGWYPFNRIGDAAPVLAAKQELARAFSRVRDSVDAIFAGVDLTAPEKPGQ